MRSTQIRRLYPALSGQERFRALARALARGDLAEANHLLGSAPWEPVSCRGLELVGAHRDYELLMANFHGAIGPALGAVMAADALAPLLEPPVVSGFGPEAACYASELREVLGKLRAVALGRARALVEALGELAGERLGLDAGTVLALVRPPVGAFLSEIRASVPGEDEIALARRSLLWPDEEPEVARTQTG